jgi:transposase
MAKYHQVAVIPARVRKPKDKAKAESGVLIVEREVMAPLRDRKLLGLSAAKEAAWALLEGVNNRPFQKLEGSREQLFREYELPELRPLPKQPYDAGIWSTAKVHIDYHIEVKKHYYSVPFQHIDQRVDVRLTSTIIEVFREGERVTSHRRGWKKGGCTTKPEHMPEKHRRIADWTPARVCSWADSAGEQTGLLARGIMERRQHPEQGVRSVLGVLSLKKKYGRDRLEAACRRAVELGGYSRLTVRSILEKGLDKAAAHEGEKRHIGHHENVRGPKYYEEVGCHATAANNR